jgi:hypothetical protein
MMHRSRRLLAVLCCAVCGTASAFAQTASRVAEDVLQAAQYDGADMGAKINAAIASLKGGCGIVALPPGRFAVATQIRKPACVLIEGNGALLIAGPSELPAIVCGQLGSSLAGGDPGAYTPGGIVNLTLSGVDPNKSRYGIWLGGDPTGHAAPAGFTDFLERFENVHVRGFQYGYAIGAGAFQSTWFGGSIESNIDGMFFVPLHSGIENMNMHGTQILNNYGWGIDAPDAENYQELTLYGVSIDYNPAGAIRWANGQLAIFGGHLEQVTHAVISSPPSNGHPVIKLIGTGLGLEGATGSDEAFIEAGGTDEQLYLTSGITPGSEHPVKELVHWATAGASPLLFAEPYEYRVKNVARPLALVQPAADRRFISGQQSAISQSTPATSHAACMAGTTWSDDKYLYVCLSSGSIKRVALSGF